MELGITVLSHFKSAAVAKGQQKLLSRERQRKDSEGNTCLLSPATVNRYMVALHSAIQFGIHPLEWISANPVHIALSVAAVVMGGLLIYGSQQDPSAFHAQPVTPARTYSRESNEETNKKADTAIHDDVMRRLQISEDLLAGVEIDLKNGNLNDPDLLFIGATLQVINGAAGDLQVAWHSQNKLTPSDLSHIKAVEARLSSFQQRAFPKLRLAFKKRVGETLWEQNIEVGIAGKSTIVFVGALFASNAHINQVQTQLSELLNKLRFKHARYEWYRGSRGWSYTMETPNDAAVAVYDNGFTKLDKTHP